MPDYDYRYGWFFVTVCVLDRESRLGQIVEGNLALSEVGRVVATAWYDLPRRFPGIGLDAFVVMPNHVHGIIVLDEAVGGSTDTGAMNCAPTRSPTVGSVVRAWKAVVSREIRATTDSAFAWQRGYYEHVIRDAASLDRVRAYVDANPGRWEEDAENPANLASNREGEGP